MTVEPSKPVRLKIKVVPSASSSRVVGWLGDALKIRVSAPPERGKANKAVVAILSKVLGVSEKSVAIASGHHSANKVVEISGITDAEVESMLADL